MSELRRFHRVELSHRIELVYRDRSYHGHLNNLSQNGALLRLDDDLNLPAGQPCLLRIYPENTGQSRPPWQLWSEAIHGHAGLIGLRFASCDDDTRIKLAQLVDQIPCESEGLRHGLERIRRYLDDFHRTH